MYVTNVVPMANRVPLGMDVEGSWRRIKALALKFHSKEFRTYVTKVVPLAKYICLGNDKEGTCKLIHIFPKL